MKRRHFLQALATAAAGASALLVDPEKLLWTPGKKSFFIPEKPRLANIREMKALSPAQQVASLLPKGSAVVERLTDGEVLIEDPHRYTVTVAGGMYQRPRSFHYDATWKMIGVRLPDGRTVTPSDARARALNVTLFGADYVTDTGVGYARATNGSVRLTKVTPSGVKTFEVDKDVRHRHA